MDIGRSAFASTMRPDAQNPSADFAVRWFFVPRDRPALGVPTTFGSSVYDDYRFTQSTGELRETRTWWRGGPPLFVPQGAPGFCGTADQWLNGWPAGTPGCTRDGITGECVSCGAAVALHPVREALAISGGPEPLLHVAEVEQAAALVSVFGGQAVAEVESPAEKLQLVAGQRAAEVESPTEQLQLAAGRAIAEVLAPRPAESPLVLGKVGVVELPASKLQFAAGQAGADVELPAAQLQLAAGQAGADVERPAGLAQIAASQAAGEALVAISEKPPKVSISTACCSGSTPATVTQTFSGFTGPLVGLNGYAFNLTYNGTSGQWEGDYNALLQTGTGTFFCSSPTAWKAVASGRYTAVAVAGGSCASPIAFPGVPVIWGSLIDTGNITISY